MPCKNNATTPKLCTFYIILIENWYLISSYRHKISDTASSPYKQQSSRHSPSKTTAFTGKVLSTQLATWGMIKKMYRVLIA